MHVASSAKKKSVHDESANISDSLHCMVLEKVNVDT